MVFISSCAKEDATAFVENIDQSIASFDYFRAIRSDADAKFFVINSTANFGHNGINQPRTYIKANNNDKSFMRSVSSVTLNGKNIHLENETGANVYGPDEELVSIYGGPVELTFDGNEKQVRILADYAPNPLRLETTESPLELFDQKKLSWNADNNNSGPVILLLKYSPLDNPDLAEDYPEEVVHYVGTVDDGSHTFLRNDFSSIPPNSLCVFTLIRGVANISEIKYGGSNSDISFIVASYTDGFVRMLD